LEQWLALRRVHGIAIYVEGGGALGGVGGARCGGELGHCACWGGFGGLRGECGAGGVGCFDLYGARFLWLLAVVMVSLLDLDESLWVTNPLGLGAVGGLSMMISRSCSFGQLGRVFRV
jgi:hypothetical protein